MRGTLFITAAMVAALAVAGCNKQQQDNAENAAASANPGQTPPVNAGQDAVGAAVGATSAATLGSYTTPAFAENAAMGNMYEIEAAKIAQSKSKNSDVKSFAAMMIKDHTAMMNEMKPLITAAGQTPPTELDQRRKGFLDNLNAAPADQFDKTYIDQQVAAHEETLTLLNGYGEHGDDAGLKGAATKSAPKVQAHLDQARSIQSKLSGGSGAGATNSAAK